MSKFTEQDVKDIAIDYAKHCIGGLSTMNDGFDSWWTEEQKPAKKIIDMAHFIKSGIDMEFSDPEVDTLHIGKLTRIHITTYRKDDGLYWRQCRPRLNHKMYVSSGECPLPEGFNILIHHRSGTSGRSSLYSDFSWTHKYIDADIIGYEILGLADGWVYSWESDE